MTDNLGVFADVGPRPPPGHVPRLGTVAIPASPGRGELRRPDAEGTLESVRVLLERLLEGVTDVGWRDLDREVIQECMGAPRDFRGIAIRVALLADRARAQVPRRDEDPPEEEQGEDSEAADTGSDPGYDSH